MSYAIVEITDNDVLLISEYDNQTEAYATLDFLDGMGDMKVIRRADVSRGTFDLF